VATQSTELNLFISKLRLQFQQVLNDIASGNQRGASQRFSAQIVIICEQLTTLSLANKSIALALALRSDNAISPLTHHCFCCALIISKIGHQQQFHLQYINDLVSAALTMRLGLDLNNQQLSDVIYRRQKLTTAQQKYYYSYPLHGASFLHKQQIISKNAIVLVTQHQELLDGSGYPKKRQAHQISPGGKLLAIVNKFVEQISPRENREPFSIAQSLSYLARQSQRYCPTFCQNLALATDQAAPGMFTQLTQHKFGLITSVDLSSQTMTALTYTLVENSWLLTAPEKSRDMAPDTHYQVCPSNLSDQEFDACITEHQLEQRKDLSQSIGRLTPNIGLTKLLQALDSETPDKNDIADLISKLPDLGQRLLQHLSTQYPNRKFNHSFHALQMAGFSQVRPVLSMLALRHQLSHYQFPLLNTLDQKVDTLLAICHKISEFTPHVLPSQLAMFALLNVAPLYFDPRLHQLTAQSMIALKDVSPTQSASLFGLSSNNKQQQIIETLARLWQCGSNTQRIVTLANDLTKTNNRYHHEVVLGYQLAIMMCHQLYHQVPLEQQSVKTHLTTTARKLKMSADSLAQLQHFGLELAPFCELSHT